MRGGRQRAGKQLCCSQRMGGRDQERGRSHTFLLAEELLCTQVDHTLALTPGTHPSIHLSLRVPTVSLHYHIKDYSPPPERKKEEPALHQPLDSIFHMEQFEYLWQEMQKTKHTHTLRCIITRTTYCTHSCIQAPPCFCSHPVIYFPLCDEN